ncbi:hypothetical protein JTE90_007789 [Oedothorax gibbosus]|uniref:Uncharacterized protein n=1 Tax=Oedothorax gibbosus TaxID=931172 RepID=A0AAV6UCJ6_9ARAC|nr:hypothetical protein JTE90_007789 [Oedothorax gibbosus]
MEIQLAPPRLALSLIATNSSVNPEHCTVAIQYRVHVKPIGTPSDYKSSGQCHVLEHVSVLRGGRPDD